MKCIICESQNFKILFNVKSYDIFQCQSCKLIFMNPDVPIGREEQFLKQIYKSDYFNKKKDRRSPGYSEDYVIDKKSEIIVNSERRLRKIEKLYPLKGALLDIGCAAGFFLDVARSRGWQVTGVEISPQIADFGRNELRLDIRKGIFEKIEFPENYFDVITAWDVIEHILNPVEFLAKAQRLLKLNGLLVLGTPNIGSLAYFLRGKNWVQFKPPEHIYYYSPNTLGLLLKKYFSEVVVDSVFPPFFKIKPSIKAYYRYFLYGAFNVIAKFFHRDEYIISYAVKKSKDSSNRTTGIYK